MAALSKQRTVHLINHKETWRVPAVLLLGGFSDPWAAEWPGVESYSRIGLSHLHLPLNNRGTCVSVRLLPHWVFSQIIWALLLCGAVQYFTF